MSEPALAKMFYGRKNELELIKCQLRKAHFLALVSPEKRGKSALLIEGLIPHLIRGNFHGQAGPFWKVAHIKANEDPFGALAHAFSRPGVLMHKKISPDFEEKIRLGLMHGTTNLSRLYRSSARIQHFNLLIIVDNFERLLDSDITPDGDFFIEVLVDGLEHLRVPLYLVISIHPQAIPLISMDRRYKTLSKYVERSQFHLHHLNQSDLQTAIQDCSEFGESKLDEATKQKILDDLYFDEEQLVNLRDYLLKLRSGWKPSAKPIREQKKPKIKIQKESPPEQETGEPVPVLTKPKRARAVVDKVYESLPTRYQQEVSRSLFLSLVKPGDTNQDVFQSKTIQALAEENDLPEDVIIKVVAAFREAGILTTSEMEMSANSLVSIDPRANLSQWPRLKDWMNAQEKDQNLLGELVTNMELYHSENRDEKHLIGGGTLKTIKDWWEDARGGLALDQGIEDQIEEYLSACSDQIRKKVPVPVQRAEKTKGSQIKPKTPKVKPVAPQRKKIVIKKRK